MNNQVKLVKVSDITHKHLQRIGNKGDTFENIIAGLIQDKLINQMDDDIRRIIGLSGDDVIDDMTYDQIVNETRNIFDEIRFDYGIYPEWNLDDAIQMAMDEDYVGSAAYSGGRKLTLSEVVINTYCMYLEMPSPTFSNGGMVLPTTNIK